MVRKKGSILVLSMFLLTVITLLGGLFLTMAVGNVKLQQKDSERQKAYWIAKAGVAELVHNLRGYYNLYEQYNAEKEYGGGKYKIGSATLIGRGYHNTMAVSVGEYPLPSTVITNTSKYALIAEVTMNTPTDYVQFSDMKSVQYYSRNLIGGPIHVNGDVVVGRSWGNLGLMKSNSEYGPVLEASGKIYNSAEPTPTNQGYVVVGEGKIPVTWAFDLANYTKSAYITQPGVGLVGWPGVEPNLWPYDNKTYGGPLVVTKTGPDGAEYKYNLLDDKSTGAKEIKVPTTNSISYETFRTVIDPAWHITFSNPVGKATYITNEILYAASGMGNKDAELGGSFGVGTGAHRELLSGLVSFDAVGAEISIPAERDMNYIKLIALKIKGSAFHFRGVVGGCSPVNRSYAQTDRSNHKVKLAFPLYIDKFLFQGPPGTWGAPGPSIWRGRYFKGDSTGDYTGMALPSGTGLPNQILQIPLEYVETATSIVSEDLVHPVRVFVGPKTACVEWTRAPDNDLNSAAITTAGNPFFAVDYAGGRILFGDGGKCAIPALNTRIQVVFSHDFDISLGVEAWLNEKVRAVKLDLSTIDETNAPRHPKYKDSTVPIDRQKYGVIYSEVPLVVWGTPKVPVTIVCMDDIYVGPINSTQNNPTSVDNWWTPIVVSEAEDSKNLKPVGIIAKGIVFYDLTLAPSYPENVFNNTWAVVNKRKTFLLNKVCIYHSWLKSPGSLGRYDFYRYRTGVIAMGGTFSAGDGYGGLGQGGPLPKIIGSIYNCADNDLITATAAKNLNYLGYGGSDTTSIAYANSFRRNPPPHIPKTTYITNYRILNEVDNAEKFIEKLKEYLAAGGSTETEYSPEFAKTISDLIVDLDQ